MNHFILFLTHVQPHRSALTEIPTVPRRWPKMLCAWFVFVLFVVKSEGTCIRSNCISKLYVNAQFFSSWRRRQRWWRQAYSMRMAAKKKIETSLNFVINIFCARMAAAQQRCIRAASYICGSISARKENISGACMYIWWVVKMFECQNLIHHAGFALIAERVSTASVLFLAIFVGSCSVMDRLWNKLPDNCVIGPNGLKWRNRLMLYLLRLDSFCLVELRAKIKTCYLPEESVDCVFMFCIVADGKKAATFSIYYLHKWSKVLPQCPPQNKPQVNARQSALFVSRFFFTRIKEVSLHKNAFTTKWRWNRSSKSIAVHQAHV